MKAQVREQANTIAALREDASSSRHEHTRETSSFQHMADELRAALRAKEHEASGLRTELQTARAGELILYGGSLSYSILYGGI